MTQYDDDENSNDESHITNTYSNVDSMITRQFENSTIETVNIEIRDMKMSTLKSPKSWQGPV